jgi:hypothetical protein
VEEVLGRTEDEKEEEEEEDDDKDDDDLVAAYTGAARDGRLAIVH